MDLRLYIGMPLRVSLEGDGCLERFPQKKEMIEDAYKDVLEREK